MGNTKQYATLVSAGEVIDKTFTNKNTDPVLVSENTIVLSELAHIRPLLGEKLLETTTAGVPKSDSYGQGT